MSPFPQEDAGPIVLWLVEDDDEYQESFLGMVEEEPGIACPYVLADLDEVEALMRQAGVRAPDVVLMDVGLPGRSGLEGVSIVKTRFPQTPIVMLTVNDAPDIIFEALQRGASGYLLKDMPWGQMVTAIHEAVRGGMLMPRSIAEKVQSYFQSKAPSVDYDLTQREREILQCMCEGMSYREIAEALHVSPHTSGNHIRKIYQKLHVHSAVEAVSLAIREQLVG